MNCDIKKIAVIGGDKRQLFLARALCDDGFEVFLAGFDKISAEFCSVTGAEEAALEADIVILPVPCLRADGTINAPFSNDDILFSKKEIKALREKPVFTSFAERLLRRYPELKGGAVYDYAAREDFAVLNAVPTAEGAIALAMDAFEGTIDSSRVLVTGFGKVSKALSRRLAALGAEVTVAARKSVDRAGARAMGCRAADFSKLGAGEYDLVFNTVPAMVFDRAALSRLNRNTLIFDLASLPGGVDFEAASELGVDARRALALPGKCSPKTAGGIIKTTVFEIIKEVMK